jgi:hypothetical protein
MKNNLIEEDIVRIKKLINNVLKERFELIKDENIISEQIFPLLTKYLGKGIVTKLETSMGDDVVKNLERLFVKGEVNFTKNSLGKIVVKSASGTEVEMRTISAALDAVSKGTMKVDDVVKLLPRKLKDGTEFRSIFDTQLRNAKPKPKPNTNTTSGSSTGGNTGKQSFGPKKNKSLLDPKNTIMDPAKTEQNLSTLRKEYPGFKLFENQVDLVPGFSSEARNYVKLNFINGEGDVINQLIEARTKLISARFGPLSVLVEKILRKPVKSALWLCAALFALYLVKQSLTGIKIMDDRTTKGMKWLDQNLPGGETNNSNGGSDGAKKGDLD